MAACIPFPLPTIVAACRCNGSLKPLNVSSTSTRSPSFSSSSVYLKTSQAPHKHRASTRSRLNQMHSLVQSNTLLSFISLNSYLSANSSPKAMRHSRVVTCSVSEPSQPPTPSSREIPPISPSKGKEKSSPVFVFDQTVRKPTRLPPKLEAPPVIQRRPEPRQPIIAADEDKKEIYAVPENHKSGYVAIIGRPNAGKSTLMNALVGQKLAIVTQKPQTTRHRILGICSADAYQMILYDTPGVMLKQTQKLDEVMMHNVRSAAVNADAIVVVVDCCLEPEQVVIYSLTSSCSRHLAQVLDMVDEAAAAASERRPLLLVLNKKDMLKPGELARKLEVRGLDAVIAVSAKYGQGVDELKAWAVQQLPPGPAYFPKDVVSEHPERFFVSEIVREKILLQYDREIPYVCQVNVTTYIERPLPAKDYIALDIIVERDSQRGILLGKGGHALKTLATAARLDIEDFVEKEVFLEIKVKVKEKWRQDEKLLQEFGIDER
eukprot:jgi/Mesen1/4654/ME000241S03698